MMQIYCVGVGLALVAERPVLVIVNYPAYKAVIKAHGHILKFSAVVPSLLTVYSSVSTFLR